MVWIVRLGVRRGHNMVMKRLNVPDATDVVGHGGPIPGERDRDTLTHAEPGALGGGIAGERIIPTSEPIAVDAELRRELQREGGGD